MLDARIASALNKIIQNSYFKNKVSLEELHDFYDYFGLLALMIPFFDYADLFSSTYRNDDVQEFDTSWDEILLSMTKIPPDDVLESLHKIRIRESDQLKIVLELYDMEIHQKISVPDYQKM